MNHTAQVKFYFGALVKPVNHEFMRTARRADLVIVSPYTLHRATTACMTA